MEKKSITDTWSWDRENVTPSVAKMFKNIGITFSMQFGFCMYEDFSKYEVLVSTSPTKKIENIILAVIFKVKLLN